MNKLGLFGSGILSTSITVGRQFNFPHTGLGGSVCCKDLAAGSRHMNIGRLSAIDKSINSVSGIENCVFYLWSIVHRKTAWEFIEFG